jgi:8-oxo-dGTP pyrophosphatase MutT (NUDIX family)
MSDATQPRRATDPSFTHGDWVQVYVDPDESGRGPGFIRIEERNGAPGVAILPIADGHIGLVTVFRRPPGQVCREIPRGFGGEGGGPRVDALRELREETGIGAHENDLVDLGVVFANSGLLANAVHLFAVSVDRSGHPGFSDTVEVQRFDWVPLVEVYDEIRAGRMEDSFTHVALLRAMARGLLPPP